MRLIDADALYEKADKYAGGSFAVGLILEAIVNAPTVEAESIKHGHWEYDEISGNNQCSVCFSSNERISGYCNSNEFEYCPWCGAKMDLEKESENERI